MSVAYYTREGLSRLKERLHRLQTEERPKLTEEIAEARAKGDLSENAEYHAAKEKQGFLEMEIAQLKTEIAHARVLESKDIDTSQVSILAHVTLRNTATSSQRTYTLVAEKEANVKVGKISVNSPLGKSLLGKKVGEVVTVQAPVGPITYKILSIKA